MALRKNILRQPSYPFAKKVLPPVQEEYALPPIAPYPNTFKPVKEMPLSAPPCCSICARKDSHWYSAW